MNLLAEIPIGAFAFATCVSFLLVYLLLGYLHASLDKKLNEILSELRKKGDEE